MLTPPIPKPLLIHTVSYHEILGKDSFNNAVYADPIEIKHVRFDSSVSYTRDGTQNMINLSGVVFVDTRHSTNIPLEFQERAMITFNGTDYTIVNVIPCYHAMTNKIRHYEIEVV